MNVKSEYCEERQKETCITGFIFESLEDLERAISHGRDLTELVTKRIDSTLSPSGPNDSSKTLQATPQRECSSLACFVKRLREDIIRDNESKQDILNRVEL